MADKSIVINPLSEKILQGIRKAVRKLVETSAANDESLVIGDKDGNIKTVPAKELLKTLPE
ncbi:MAG: hypothetical protein J7621_26240 [Niastella sp.]|nr:hypothetical protein [Niastella sp.]